MPELVQNPFFGMMLFNALALWPLWRILRRAGLAPWWSLLVFVPLVGLALVFGRLAHTRWPALPAKVKPVRKARRSV